MGKSTAYEFFMPKATLVQQLSEQRSGPLIPSTRRILAAEVNSDSIAASIVETHADSLIFSIVAC